MHNSTTHLFTPLQRDTMPDCARTRVLALGLARVTGETVAILAWDELYWTACPADLAVFWQREIDAGTVVIVETITGESEAA